MDTPGVSIFQGADAIKVNSTLERHEEEEALQDQKRREAELGNLLENAFDDLDDDDEDSTVDSTTNYSSNLLPVHQLPILPTLSVQQQQQVQQESDNMHGSDIHKLKMMLDSKNHELNNINKIATDAQRKIDDYQKRLTITQAELERALREKQNTHELLVDSKEKCSNLENTIDKMGVDKKSLEVENTDLIGQLETVQTLLTDMQSKYKMIEHDSQRNGTLKAEVRIRQLEDSKRAQTDLLQQQVNQINSQLAKKIQELEHMQSRYNALQSSHDTMLVDKATKINELNAALDVAQRRYNNLVAKPDYESECKRQKQTIVELHNQIATMENTISQLNERVNGTTAELDLMDTLLQQHENELESNNRLPSRLSGSTPLSPADRIGHIKKELYRALGNLKIKREEVRKLEKQLDERGNELHILRTHENKTLVELATLRDQNSVLDNRVKILQEQIDERQHSSSFNTSKLHTEIEMLIDERATLRQSLEQQTAECEKLNKQLKEVQSDLNECQHNYDNLKLKNDQLTEDNRELRKRSTADNVQLELQRHKILLKDAQSEVERVKILYTDIVNEKETISYQFRKLSESDSLKELQEQRQQVAQLQRNLQLAELKSQEISKILDTEKIRHERELQTLREKCERQKHDEVLKATKESSNNCNKCIDHMGEITKIEIQMIKLQSTNSEQANELNELKTEVEQSKILQTELDIKMKQVAEQEKLIDELRMQAQQLEGQLKEQATKHVDLTSPIVKKTALSSSSGTNNTQISPTLSQSPEFTRDRIKRIEQRVRDEMVNLFATELKGLTTRLQQEKEKNLVLQREYQLICRDLQKRQMEVDVLKQTILAEREQVQEVLGDKDVLQHQELQKTRDELQAKTHRITSLLQEIQEQQASIESERRSMKALMSEWNKQKQSIQQVEHHWHDQVKKLREAHEVAIEALQKRYQSAKRTAYNYKLYADEKEAHMKREYDRIKEEYHISLSQVEATMQQRIGQGKCRDHQSNHHRKHKKDDNDKENTPSNH